MGFSRGWRNLDLSAAPLSPPQWASRRHTRDHATAGTVRKEGFSPQLSRSKLLRLRLLQPCPHTGSQVWRCWGGGGGGGEPGTRVPLGAHKAAASQHAAPSPAARQLESISWAPAYSRPRAAGSQTRPHASDSAPGAQGCGCCSRTPQPLAWPLPGSQAPALPLQRGLCPGQCQCAARVPAHEAPPRNCPVPGSGPRTSSASLGCWLAAARASRAGSCCRARGGGLGEPRNLTPGADPAGCREPARPPPSASACEARLPPRAPEHAQCGRGRAPAPRPWGRRLSWGPGTPP